MNGFGRHRIVGLIAYSGLGIFALAYIYPVIWLLLNSFKRTSEMFDNPWGFPTVLRWENYRLAWTTGRIGLYFLNSVFVSIISLAAVVLLSAMAAFAIKRMRWKGANLVLGLFTLGMMIPIHASLLPLFIFFTKLQMVNTYGAVMLIYIAFGLPAAILILSGFLGSIPRELEEAAVMDGSSMPRVFWRIIIPVAKPAIFTVGIFSFITIWNELLVALVFISDASRMTLPVGLTNFKGQYATDFAPLLAAIAMTIVPSIIVYTVLNNRIIEGMTAGAVKG